MTSQSQYLASGAIYAVIGLSMLAAFSAGVYGFMQNGNPNLVIISAFFGVIAFSAIGATIYAFHKALER